MNFAIRQFQAIRDFDAFEQSPQAYKRCSSLVFHKEIFMKETQENQMETERILGIPRSLKSKSTNNQTSFEQDIVNKHFKAVDKILQKYVESCGFHVDQCSAGLEVAKFFQTKENMYQPRQKLINLIQKNNDFLEEKEKKQFLIDLQYEESLCEFLQKLCEQYPTDLCLQLIYLANLFWQAYLPFQERELTQKQIEIQIQKLLTSEAVKKYSEKLNVLLFKTTLRKPQRNLKNIEENCKQLLIKYGTTILLVVEEYFNNPFDNGNQKTQNPKKALCFRQISDNQFSQDQEEINFSFGTKKRKF